MTSAFPPQLAAMASRDLAQSALPHAPVRRASSPRKERPRQSDQLAIDLQALVDAGLVEFRDGPGVRHYVLSPRGLELTLGL
ncbi:MAG: hypothetical protein QOF65_347 [Thermoleophilaceae bacterium]|jgi:hypothetical protein|nr:hypothetical protein [Thermoleophilaceae bacterium]MEA2435791.1 hypothetical protein [Thermoleophilaceae bacterium]